MHLNLSLKLLRTALRSVGRICHPKGARQSVTHMHTPGVKDSKLQTAHDWVLCMQAFYAAIQTGIKDCLGTRPESSNRRRTAQMTLHSACEALECRQLLTVYEVGPGMAFTSIGDVPWHELAAGDTVQIHGRATPYHEMILITGSGTVDAPIRIVGVPGPNGEAPIIDGRNAVLGPNLDYAYSGTATRGLLTISASSQDPWGYKPSYIEISGLTLRNARVGNSFTRPGGVVSQFATNAAGLFVERGENITIRDCVIENNSNGLFVASGGSEELQSRDILVQSNTIHGNGNVGSDRQHNVYTEAIGITFEDNHLGPLLPGSGGINLKDRSAGLVIRNNWIEGGALLLDLVDPEESWVLTTADPGYKQTFVYGNILVNKSGPGNAGNLIHYGGDTGDTKDYRKETLYFYHNTVMIEGVRSGPDARWFTDIFRFDTNQQVADVRNNIFYCGLPPDAPPSTEVTGFGLFDDMGGTANFGVNWISPGWHTWRNDNAPVGSQITGTGNFITNSENDPGFADLAGLDFHLLSTSESIDQAGVLANAALGAHEVIRQYLVHLDHTDRTIIGSAADLGAFEGAAPIGPGQIQFSSQGATVSEATGLLRVSVRRVGGNTGAVNVDFTIEDGSAVNGSDFQASSGTLIFADGQTTAVIEIAIVNNTLTGPDKTFQIHLSNPTGGSTLGTATTLVVTIQNDEAETAGPSTVRFAQPTANVSDATGQVMLELARSGDLSQAAVLQFRTKAGSAKAGRNFVAPSGTIQFSAGQASQQLSIQLLNSAIGRRTKSFKVMLVTASNGARIDTRAKLVRIRVSD